MTVLGLTVVLLLADAAPPTAGSALSRVAGEVSGVVVQKKFAAPVGVFVEGAPSALPRALASLVAARLAAASLDAVAVDAKDASGAERVARELGVVSLVRLTVSLENQRLVVRGDAIVTRANFWAGDVPVRGSQVAVLAATAEADAEVSTMNGSPPTVPSATVPLELRFSSILKGPQVPAALAVGDLDGDQKAEIVALVQDRVVVFTARARCSPKLSLAPRCRPAQRVSHLG